MTRFASNQFDRYAALTAQFSAPLGVVDADAVATNTADLVRRAAGTPMRLATKSLRCLPLTQHLLAQPGFAGVLSLTLAESLWLHAHGVRDIVLGYPTVDRVALRALGQSDDAELPVTLMVDSVEQVDFLAEHVQPTRQRQLRVCLELDAGLQFGSRVHIGARRSPVHTPAALVALAEQLLRRGDVRIEGLMAYESQIAGVADGVPGLQGPILRAMQAASRRELAGRRRAAVDALARITDLRFVNGGGTGSIESTRSEGCVTEVAVGSGVLAPALFDHYRGFSPRPAAFFALDVVRRPAAGIATVAGGGWIASGPPGADRSPTVAWPQGLSLTPREGAGEAQTPVVGAAADSLQVGDRVWLRHAKAGELCEHLNELHVISGDTIADTWTTYRGAGLLTL